MTATAAAPVMADVARLAGVSHQTVSRVINDHPHIRSSTRERVLEAIRELGYRPNSAARILVTKRSRTIGIITTDGPQYGPVSTHHTIQDAIREAGYFPSSVALTGFDVASLRNAIEHLVMLSIEGIVVIVSQGDAIALVSNHDFGVPVVVVEGDLSRGPVAVGVDQELGARAATQHLIELGHRHIAHVTGPDDWTESIARTSTWRQTLRGAGLTTEHLLPGDWSAASGYAAGRALLARPEVTAVFCGNDQMALGVMRAFHEAGRAVPGDLSIVGFDDIPDSAYFEPPLTTVRQDFAAVGRRAIEVLHAAISGTVAVGRAGLIAPELVLRASTSTVRTDHDGTGSITE